MPKESDQIAQDSPDADSFLCERCSKININEILSLRTIPLEGHDILYFRSAFEIVENPNCSFCQALDFISPPNFKKPSHFPPCYLVAVSSKEARARNRGFIQGDVSPENSFLLTTNLWAGFVWRMQDAWGVFGSRVLPGCLALPSVLKKEDDLFIADSIGSTVDFNMVRSWIKTCEKKHGNYCAPSSAQNSTLRLIECNSRRIVATPKPPEVSTYAALSYVWGSQESDRIRSEELPRQLPKTIEDAITVTKSLDIPYLWIDRYCINQDDEREKHNQCSLMHRIYENAHITIIAAAGSEPNHGLPGIGSSKRSYPSVRIGLHLFVPTLPDPRLSIQAAKWSTRGWTYQESQLSKRRLIFTDRQVLFVCRRACTDEAEQKLKPGTELPDEDDRPSTSISPFCMSESPRKIWDEINQFLKLDLSRQEDCLNAMLGILQRYQESNWKDGIALRHLAGLPAVKEISNYGTPAKHGYSTWTSNIINSLGWMTMEETERREVPYPGFPSWSWTAWKAAEYHNPHLQCCDSGPFHWDKFIFVERPDGSLVKGNELDSLLEAGHDFSRIRFIHLEAPSLNFMILSTDYRWLSGHQSILRGSSNKLCLIQNHDFEFFCHFELTNLRVHIPRGGLRCWGIMCANYLFDGELKHLFLLVTKVGDWYERIGLAEVHDLDALQPLETRSFRLG